MHAGRQARWVSSWFSVTGGRCRVRQCEWPRPPGFWRENILDGRTPGTIFCRVQSQHLEHHAATFMDDSLMFVGGFLIVGWNVGLEAL